MTVPAGETRKLDKFNFKLIVWQEYSYRIYNDFF